MGEAGDRLREVAERYGIQIVHAFGSRAREALKPVEGRIEGLPQGDDPGVLR